ncbi:hypothetical protein ACS6Z1_10365, partial [Streptococcus suis]
PFFSKNSKKDKHQNDVCLQSGTAGRQFFYIRIGCFNREIGKLAICITWSSNFDGFLFISYLLISG